MIECIFGNTTQYENDMITLLKNRLANRMDCSGR